ncbi:MAG: MFS transporter [Pseudomonadota bacterium]
MLKLRLGSFYAFYFALVSLFTAFWPLYLAQYYSLHHVGSAVAILLGTKLIAPYIWGWLADRDGRRLFWIRCAAIATTLSFIAVFSTQNIFYVLAIHFIFSFFWNAALPQYEAFTIDSVAHHDFTYGQIRLYGSIGFIITTLIAGTVISYTSLNTLPIMILIVMVFWTLSTYFVPKLPLSIPSNKEVSEIGKIKSYSSEVTKQRRIALTIFILTCFLMNLSHGPYYAFFSIALGEVGFKEQGIALLWSWGVIAEIVFFAWGAKVFRARSYSFIFTLCFIASFIRWICLPWFLSFSSLPAMAISIFVLQTLHALTFGAFHSSCITWVANFFQSSQAGRGQAIYSSVSFGAGGALGALVSGWMWNDWGTSLFYLAAGASLLGLMLLSCRNKIHKITIDSKFYVH